MDTWCPMQWWMTTLEPALPDGVDRDRLANQAFNSLPECKSPCGFCRGLDGP